MKLTKNKLSLLLLFIMISVLVNAQTTVKGMIKDAQGMPLPGVNVILDGTTTGVMSDLDGNYTLVIAEDGTYTLIASYVGFTKFRKSITADGNDLVINISMTEDAESLDQVIITGVTNPRSKIESSVSVTTMRPSTIKQSAPRTTAEIFRTIPGIRSESSGGEGNANMTVRGLPISAGGSRYLQLQEDGLPLLQFGDIAFSTPDMFLRSDFGLRKIEAIRGGSGSTLGTNSPGGIVNFISNDGKRKGGRIGYTTGVNFNEHRGDFAYGAPLNDKTRAFVSGFYRAGDGLRDADTTLFKGGQIKGNLTHDLDNGFIRLNFKHLDDQTPTNMPILSQRSNGAGTSPRASNRDFLDGTYYDVNFPKDVALKGNGSTSSTDVTDGLTVQSTAVGFEFDYNFGIVNVNNKFRHAKNDGRFLGIFPIGTVAGNGDYQLVTFNTEMNDMDNTVNDLKLSAAFDLGAGTLTPLVGLYYSKQNVDLTWNFNTYDVNAATNTATFAANTATTFGGCCGRDIDVQYDTLSPYVGLGWESGGLNVDASVRRDRQDADGQYTQVSAANTYLAADRNNVDYSIRETSYSVGANYEIKKNLAVFARTSRGYAFNADRIMFGTVNLDGGTIPTNEVKQHEIGAKFRTGNLNTFVTLFKADVAESNFDATTLVSSANEYDAQGVELEMGYSIGAFRVSGGVTYTDAEVVKSNQATFVGKAPDRQAKWVYQITPSWRATPKLNIGASIVGTSSSQDQLGSGNPDNATKMGSFATINPYVNYKYDKNWALSVRANNILDKVGITEAQPGVARSVDGRAIRASVIYSFK